MTLVTFDLDLLVWLILDAMLSGEIVYFIVKHWYGDYTRAIRSELNFQLNDEWVQTKEEWLKRKQALKDGLDSWLNEYHWSREDAA